MITFVQLGRYGDILNMLPFVQAVGDVRFVVGHRYASLLRYVPEVTEIKVIAYELDRVLKKNWGVVSQVDKNPAAQKWRETGISYSYAQWQIIREQLNIDLDYDTATVKLSYQPKPLALKEYRFIYCSEGVSSPLPNKKLFEKTCDDLGGFNIKRYAVPEFVQLLDLYAGSRLLVSIDSGPLHLSRACSGLKVVGLTRNDPWYGTKPWGQWVDRLYYDSWTPSTLKESIQKGLK